MSVRFNQRIVPIIGISLAGLSAGCAVKPAEPPPPKVSFGWTPKTVCAAPASAPVTFAVVTPKFASVAGSGSYIDAAAAGNPQIAAWIKPRVDMYEEFASSMRNDFFSLLTCKGFTTKGPFASYDEMVFPDRTGSDLVLAPELDIRLAVQSEPVQPSLGVAMLGAAMHARQTSAKLQGRATLSGRVTLAIRESVTETRMWTRSIEIPPETFQFVSAREYPLSASALLNEVVTGDPAFLAALGPRMLAIYTKALSASWNYTNPQEMRLVKSQSLEPRRRAVSGMSR